jgi:bifunctional non-homologous end joining protein LigD
MRQRYVLPSAPALRSAPPRGEQWIHAAKFDGWRIQLQKHGVSAAVFTKNGHDHSSRIRWMVGALARLKGVRSLIIDGELVACDGDDLPDFYALYFRRRDNGLCLFERKARL